LCGSSQGFGFPERLVDAAEGRTAVPGYERRRVQAALLVALMLQHRQAHQRLDAGHVGARRVERVLVVQGYVSYPACCLACHRLLASLCRKV
jgi:hypothetical protein